MGDAFIDVPDLDVAAINILKDPNFQLIDSPEIQVSRTVFFNTYKVWSTHKENMYNKVKDDLDFTIWHSNMLKINENKNWLNIPNLRPMVKLHKPQIEWRRVINTKHWYSQFFSKYLHQQLDLMINYIMEQSQLHIILNNSYNLINDIQHLNKENTTYHNNQRILLSFDVKSLYDSLNIKEYQ